MNRYNIQIYTVMYIFCNKLKHKIQNIFLAAAVKELGHKGTWKCESTSGK